MTSSSPCLAPATSKKKRASITHATTTKCKLCPRLTTHRHGSVLLPLCATPAAHASLCLRVASFAIGRVSELCVNCAHGCLLCKERGNHDRGLFKLRSQSASLLWLLLLSRAQVPFCECKCGTDDYIFYAASAYYILLHVTFMCVPAGTLLQLLSSSTSLLENALSGIASCTHASGHCCILLSDVLSVCLESTGTLLCRGQCENGPLPHGLP